MRRIIKILILAMLVSGVVFLVYPDQHYKSDGWGVLLKYALYLPVVSMSILMILVKGKLNTEFLFAIAWISICSLPLVTGEISGTRYALYIMPVFAALAPQWVHDAAPKIAYATLWIAALGAIYEYAVLGGFPRFQPNGYRAVSVFVNPNNLGITAVILYYLTYNLTKRRRIISFLISVSLVISSGSKTALLIFVILFALRRIRINATQAFWGIFTSIVIAISAFQVGLIPLDSAFIRLDQYYNFFSSLNGLSVNTSSENFYDIYADNAYIQSWIEIGVLAPLMYIFILTYCGIRDRLNQPLWLLFAASSMTTNILFLFPLGYIFWFYVGRCQPAQLKGSTAKLSTGAQVL